MLVLIMGALSAFPSLLLAIVLFAIVFTGIGVQTATATVASLSECVPATSASACTARSPATCSSTTRRC
mgnify:CR=1 FL=1